MPEHGGVLQLAGIQGVLHEADAGGGVAVAVILLSGFELLPEDVLGACVDCLCRGAGLRLVHHSIGALISPMAALAT